MVKGLTLAFESECSCSAPPTLHCLLVPCGCSVSTLYTIEVLFCLFFASNLSSSLGNHVGSVLCQGRSVHDVTDTFATHVGLVYDVTDSTSSTGHKMAALTARFWRTLNVTKKRKKEEEKKGPRTVDRDTAV